MSPHAALRVVAPWLAFIGSALSAGSSVTTPPHVRIMFVPQSDSFAASARDYQRMWAVEEPGPYPKAWDEAMALTAAQRAERWRALVAERLPTRR